MNEALDKASVIEALTSGIGVGFGKATRKSFREQLARIEHLGLFRDSPRDEQQSLIDLLALASFYQNVVVPMESSRSFIYVIKKAGATHLRVAGDKLDEKHANRVLAALIDFDQLLQRSQISPSLLTYPTLKRFVINSRNFFRRDEE